MTRLGGGARGETMLLQHRRRLVRRLLGAIDEPNVGTENTTDGRLQQWIVRAAEYQRVDFLAKNRRQVLLGNQSRGFTVDPAFLDERHE